QDDAERRRYLPALVAEGHVGGGFAREAKRERRTPILGGNPAHVGALAQPVVEPACAAEEIGGAAIVIRVLRGLAKVDAARDAGPRVQTRNVTRRDLDELLRSPARDHSFHFGAAPRERRKHPSIRAR